MLRFRFVSILLLACTLAGPTLAEDAHGPSGEHAHVHAPDHDHAAADATAAPAAPAPAGREAVIQVNGIVCSFCAHGVQKALGKLGILDATKYQKGVFVDVDEQRVVLALEDDAAIPFAEIGRRIRKRATSRSVSSSSCAAPPVPMATAICSTSRGRPSSSPAPARRRRRVPSLRPRRSTRSSPRASLPTPSFR